MRARIIAGLFVANIAFSVSFMLPYWLTEGCTFNPKTQVSTGVYVYKSYGSRGYHDAGIFCGKFYMACCAFPHLLCTSATEL